MAPRVFGAVDLGASGGRVIAGVIDDGCVQLEIVHRFPNGPQRSDGHLRWDISGLYAEVLIGFEQLREKYPQLESIGIDTWGVDYALLDARGNLLAEPISYRDERTSTVIDDVHRLIPPDELFAITGTQYLPINTIYQLAAELRGPLWPNAAHVVMLPDLLAYWLTGVLRTEYTIASTTGLLDVRTRDWSRPILDRLNIEPDTVPPIEQPGAVRGGAFGVLVTTVGSHDTASAVVGVPATSPDFAYISSGTWSIVGLELAYPGLTPDARAANFSNEGGVDGRIRFLRNVSGLWLLQECLREWDVPHARDLIAEAAALPSDGPTIDVDDPVFLPPGDMPHRIAESVRVSGHPRPANRAQTVRCIIDSLASAYARTLRQAAELSGRAIDVVHIVGGGSQIEPLCQLTSDLSRRPVVAGPAEATALGNVLVQARAHGAMPDSLDAMRACLARSMTLRRFEPR